MDQRFQILFSAPVNAFGLLIGKNGETLKFICRESGASLSLQHSDDMAKGTNERVIILDSLNISSFIKAYDLIIDKLKIYKSSLKTLRDDITDAKTDSIEVVKWLVNQSYCGLLIGRSGEKIKKIREVSGAWVKIAHIEESISIPNGDRLVYIRGTAKQNYIALDLVRNLVGGSPFYEVESSSLIVQPQKISEVGTSQDIQKSDKITRTVLVPIVAVSKIFGTEDGIDSNLIVLDCLELILTLVNSVNVSIDFGTVQMGDIFIEVLISSCDEKDLLEEISRIESKLKVWEEITTDKMFSAKVVVSENCVLKFMDSTNDNINEFFSVLDGEDKSPFQDVTNILTQLIILLHTLNETCAELIRAIPTSRGTKNYNHGQNYRNFSAADSFVPRVETFECYTFNAEAHHDNYEVYFPFQSPASSIVLPSSSHVESNILLESPSYSPTYHQLSMEKSSKSYK